MTTATSQSALRSGAPPCALPPRLRPKPDGPGLGSPPRRQPEQTWRCGGSAQPSAGLPTRPPSEKAAKTSGARAAQRGVRPPKPGWEGLGHSPPCRTTRRSAWPSAGGATCCSSMCERYACKSSSIRQKSSILTKFSSSDRKARAQEAPGRLFVAPAASAMMMRSALSRSARRMTGKNPLPLAHSHRRGGRRHALRRPSSRQKMRTATFRRAAGGLCRGRGPGGTRAGRGRKQRGLSERFFIFLTRLCRAASFTKQLGATARFFVFCAAAAASTRSPSGARPPRRTRRCCRSCRRRSPASCRTRPPAGP